jgi:hypothetical protein
LLTKAIPKVYLYNGVKLLKLPDYSNTDYKYMLLSGDESSATTVYSTAPLYQKKEKSIAPSGYYYYNGHLLPDVKSAKYSSNIIYRNSNTKEISLVSCQFHRIYSNNSSLSVDYITTSYQHVSWYKFVDGIWSYKNTGYSLSDMSLSVRLDEVLWSNVPIYGYNSSNHNANTSIVLYNSSTPSSESNEYYDRLYAKDNGSIISYIYDGETEIPEWKQGTVIDGDFSANSTISTKEFTTIWSNYNFCDYDDDTVLVEASEPVPVYE